MGEGLLADGMQGGARSSVPFLLQCQMAGTYFARRVGMGVLATALPPLEPDDSMQGVHGTGGNY